jgi:hypothetical protein
LGGSFFPLQNFHWRSFFSSACAGVAQTSAAVAASSDKPLWISFSFIVLVFLFFLFGFWFCCVGPPDPLDALASLSSYSCAGFPPQGLLLAFLALV